MLIDLKMSMEMEIWKIEKNLCRCCHSEGVYRNLAEPCIKEEQEEIYCDMLQEYLDINITPVSGPLCAVTYTICEDCIHRLKDACSFKQQVTQCELRFRELYIRDIIKIASSYEEIDVKQEVPDEEEKKIDISSLDDEDDDFSFNYDDDEDEDNESETKDLDIKEEQPKKAGPKKPKAKEKTKKNAARPPKLKAGETDKSTEEADKKGDIVDEYIKEKENSEKRFTCKACEVRYRRINDLRYHIIRCHLKQKFIKCKYCTETFMYYNQRKNHIYSEHSNETPVDYVCDHCKRHFKRKNTLAAHMMDVHIEKKCLHCDEKFVRRYYLFHLNEMHGVAMPTCGICGLRTLMQSALIRHQRKVHLNEKNKMCTVCKKRFYTKSNLLDHMITHEKLKVFHCDVCSKSFARKEYFKVHYRIHTGERPYSCGICNAAFVQRASLRFHMKRHPTSKGSCR